MASTALSKAFEAAFASQGDAPRDAEPHTLVVDELRRTALLLSAETQARRIAEEGWRGAQAELEREARVKAAVLDKLGSELRPPLVVVLGALDLLSRDGMDPEQRRILETAYQATSGLLGIVDDITEFFQLECGHLELDAAQFELWRMLDEIAQFWDGEAKTKGIQLRLCIAPAVPRWVVGDGARVQQVLMVLLGNALKFTEHGNVEIRVAAVESKLGNSRLAFEVSDTGIGIAETELEEIFLPRSVAGNGAGVGLAIARRWVELMGGKLEVESQLGQGSCFRFEVEFEREPVAELAGSRPSLVPEVADVEAVPASERRRRAHAELEPSLAEGVEASLNQGGEASSADPSVALDRTRITSLLSQAGPTSFVVELAEIFLVDVAQRLRALRGMESAVLVQHQLHAVKSAAGNIGAVRLAALSELFERTPERLSEARIVALEREFERVRLELSKMLPPVARALGS